MFGRQTFHTANVSVVMDIERFKRGRHGVSLVRELTELMQGALKDVETMRKGGVVVLLIIDGH